MCNTLDFLAPRELSGLCTQTTNKGEGLKIIACCLNELLICTALYYLIYYFIKLLQVKYGIFLLSFSRTKLIKETKLLASKICEKTRDSVPTDLPVYLAL